MDDQTPLEGITNTSGDFPQEQSAERIRSIRSRRRRPRRPIERATPSSSEDPLPPSVSSKEELSSPDSKQSDGESPTNDTDLLNGSVDSTDSRVDITSRGQRSEERRDQRSDRQARRSAPPAGVPSAAAIDALEAARTISHSPPEPNSELQALLQGFDEIQQRQTDRILQALRQMYTSGDTTLRSNTNLTERVGVFVDVPNLIYASRYLNRWIDFGRLLDRLAAGRRIIRAHAYSPTDPDPSAEQQFLTPVRSQGYRVTTKNYRTFASGAKKADLDLDLCMDIVRLVVARAVDTIILCSGDGDFLPLLDFCSDHGVRVEVASFLEATSDELRNACDRFYNLSTLDSIRLVRPGTNG